MSILPKCWNSWGFGSNMGLPPQSPYRYVLVNHHINSSDRVPMCQGSVVWGFSWNWRSGLTDLQEQLDLSKVVDFPIYIQNTLELIFTHMADQYVPSKSMPPISYSTHISVLQQHALTTTQYLEWNIKTYKMVTNSAIHHFGKWIVWYPWNELLSMDDIESKWFNNISATMKTYHCFFPEKCKITPRWQALDHTLP